LIGQTSTAGGPQDIEFDTVRLEVVTIPEPGTLALLGLASSAC